MKIALCSDLHLEFQDIILKNEEGAEVLILSGDILIAEDLHNHKHFDYNPYTPGALADLGRRQQTALRFRDFLKRCSFQFPHVIYIAGNHEFYHGRWKASLDHLREECAVFPNVYFLENDIKTIGEHTFIGCTLWTDCNKGDPLTLHALTDMMNDYRIIRNDDKGYTKLRPAHSMWRHHQSMSYIKNIIQGMHDEKFVVVGHHAPSKQSTHPKYQNDYLMNGGYSSDLSEFILDHPQIKLWTHGHTHDPFDYMIGTTRIVCNPRGYGGHDPQADLFELKYLDI
jgi:DNA repair exonuclease SbcCD nuclease subunit